MSRKKAIGIDFGTSKCCVGIFRNGKVDILENERGNKTTPSYVAFSDTESLVGVDAKGQATINPANTVFGVKRIIGRELNDALPKKAVEKIPCIIMDGSEQENNIRVSYRGTEELLLPQQITAMLLGKMKGLAEHHLQSDVEEAVISVPASFTSAQRQAIKDAATIAGLKVLALINEPTAAAIAYEANRRTTAKETIAVVDFGAGNLSVAIVTVRKSRVDVRAVSGSTAIGGNDIDDVLMKHVCSKYEDKHEQKLPESSAMTNRLRLCCEKLKLKLTLLPEVQETLDCFGDDNELLVIISQADFNKMMHEVVHSSLNKCLRQVIESSRIQPNEISRVVLVGGSSRIPLFQTWLKEIFRTRSLDNSVNPEEAVACGAALYASLLSGDNELKDITVNDCIPSDFRFSRKGDSTMEPVFEQHSSKTLPQRRKFPFSLQSPFNNTTQAHTFEIYEKLPGEENPHRLIGTVCLYDEFRRAVCLITDISFEVDRCGIFNVTVQLNKTGEFSEVVKDYACKLGQGKLQNAIERELQFREDDQDEKMRLEAMSCLEDLSFRLQSAMNDSKAKELFPDLVQLVSDSAKENIEWLDAAIKVTKAKCKERENALKILDYNLKLHKQEHEKKECKRVAATQRLSDYLLELEKFISRADMFETHEQAADIELQVATTKQWLWSTTTPSKNECLEKTKSLEKLRFEFECAIARNDLLQYCNYIETTMANDSNAEVTSDLAKQLSKRARESIIWVNTPEENCSKADCDARKDFLKTLHDQVVAERATVANARLTEALKSIEACCSRLTSILRQSQARENDPEMFEHVMKKVDMAHALLDNRNSFSEGECIKKLTDLNDLEKKILDSIGKYLLMEENRLEATQKTFESEASMISALIQQTKAKNMNRSQACQISQRIEHLANSLKQRDQFPKYKYDENHSIIKHLSHDLQDKAKVKTLTDKTDSDSSSIENNSASVIGFERGAGTGPSEHFLNKHDPKSKNTPDGMLYSNEDAAADPTIGTADTRKQDQKKSFIRSLLRY